MNRNQFHLGCGRDSAMLQLLLQVVYRPGPAVC